MANTRWDVRHAPTLVDNRLLQSSHDGGRRCIPHRPSQPAKSNGFAMLG